MVSGILQGVVVSVVWPRVITLHVVDGILTALHNLTRGGIEIPVILPGRD